MVSGTELVEDVRMAPDNVLSVAEPMADVRITYNLSRWHTHAHEDHLSLLN